VNKQRGGPIGHWEGEVFGGRRESTVYTHLEDFLKGKICIMLCLRPWKRSFGTVCSRFVSCHKCWLFTSLRTRFCPRCSQERKKKQNPMSPQYCCRNSLPPARASSQLPQPLGPWLGGVLPCLWFGLSLEWCVPSQPFLCLLYPWLLPNP